MHCYTIHITGAVFKTGFRYFLKAKASSLGITGRVYYENENSVGITASGTKENLKSFVECCSPGNRFFRINQMEVMEVPPEEFSSFEVEDDKTENDLDMMITNDEH
ncbi:MAG: acylphosphatase [Bacteroidales bacterium]|nr:acylphosphatase [Bacteroidales bacterium]